MHSSLLVRLHFLASSLCRWEPRALFAIGDLTPDVVKVGISGSA